MGRWVPSYLAKSNDLLRHSADRSLKELERYADFWNVLTTLSILQARVLPMSPWKIQINLVSEGLSKEFHLESFWSSLLGSPYFISPRKIYLTLSPSSYPYLTTVNTVLPAIIAGNAVLLKPSPQTPLTAERFARALIQAGVPENVIQVVHMSPELTNHAIGNPSVNFVSFTGSVIGGRTVAKTAANANGFTGVALEVPEILFWNTTPHLTPKLARWERSCIRPSWRRSRLYCGWTCRRSGPCLKGYHGLTGSIGSFFNSGQSCCAIEVCGRWHTSNPVF